VKTSALLGGDPSRCKRAFGSVGSRCNLLIIPASHKLSNLARAVTAGKHQGLVWVVASVFLGGDPSCCIFTNVGGCCAWALLVFQASNLANLARAVTAGKHHWLVRVETSALLGGDPRCCTLTNVGGCCELLIFQAGNLANLARAVAASKHHWLVWVKTSALLGGDPSRCKRAFGSVGSRCNLLIIPASHNLSNLARAVAAGKHHWLVWVETPALLSGHICAVYRGFTDISCCSDLTVTVLRAPNHAGAGLDTPTVTPTPTA